MATLIKITSPVLGYKVNDLVTRDDRIANALVAGIVAKKISHLYPDTNTTGSVHLGDAGTGAELSVRTPITLSEAGTVADTSVQPVKETPVGADTISLAAVPVAPDAGREAETINVSKPIFLAETASSHEEDLFTAES